MIVCDPTLNRVQQPFNSSPPSTDNSSPEYHEQRNYRTWLASDCSSSSSIASPARSRKSSTPGGLSLHSSKVKRASGSVFAWRSDSVCVWRNEPTFATRRKLVAYRGDPSPEQRRPLFDSNGERNNNELPLLKRVRTSSSIATVMRHLLGGAKLRFDNRGGAPQHKFLS